MSTRITQVNVWHATGEVSRGATIIIRDGVFVLGGAEPDEAFEHDIDGDGRWLIPGLIDSHMHIWGVRSSNPANWVVDPLGIRPFRAVADLEKVLRAGFTTVREAGGVMGPSIRDAIEEGAILGPRVVPAYLGLSSTGGHGDCHSLPIEWVRDRPYMATVCDGTTEIRKAVRTVLREGGEWVKVWASGAIALSDNDAPDQLHFSVDELRVLCEEAHALGLRVGAHVEFPSAIEACLEAGIDVIEHGFILDETTISSILEHDVPIVTTMALLRRYLRWVGPEITEAQREMARELLPRIMDSARRAHEAGVMLAMGSDSFAEPLTPFGANAEEMLALSEAGIPVEDCLRAATINGAKVMGREQQLGSIEEGKLGDCVLLGRISPLDDLMQVADPENIALVIKGGVPVAGHSMA
ncbi:amidohydrolase family protein [Leucobacter rhizosphaerae]|uniref:Amidohydrolase family protein n=1 Tax=Leucobacter rhizosphaerae TaxID=2932245 RepID=A0ABY4FZU1_9MICO|nr:amidohydrolase family protein [Leucobacter rhizosphaerae]UOQ61820.1 amidohydrolase family protein [Leucobacter rhizosphaerae]